MAAGNVTQISAAVVSDDLVGFSVCRSRTKNIESVQLHYMMTTLWLLASHVSCGKSISLTSTWHPCCRRSWRKSPQTFRRPLRRLRSSRPPRPPSVYSLSGHGCCLCNEVCAFPRGFLEEGIKRCDHKYIIPWGSIQICAIKQILMLTLKCMQTYLSFLLVREGGPFDALLLNLQD